MKKKKVVYIENKVATHAQKEIFILYIAKNHS